ncbi:MAG: FAD-binding monooxygenase [Hyphomicrobiales bacterium]|nr:FAD-binding monooxygenase [Hyphomicrobiales bacterium]
MPNPKTILICGGGPVGLFCALLLGRQGLSVRVFDNNPCLQDDPRAATTHPATLDVLDQAGLVEDMTRVGLVTPIFQFWDRPSGEKVAEFDHGLLKEDVKFPFVVQCEQFKTAKLIMQRLESLPNVEVLFSHAVTGLEQDGGQVRVHVDTPAGPQVHAGAYLIGADGGRSVVRKQAGVAFEGFTWEERFLVLTTPFDFQAQRGYCERSYFADPDEWCNCFKVSADGPPGLWRTVFPARQDESVEEIMSDASAQKRLQKFFPAGRDYEIVHRNLYVTHQRVASTFRQGRVLLAGDSAHVNNSIGGMGLNGGLQDAANVSEKLARVMLNGESDRLLDLYSLQRRTVSIEFVQAQSIANKKRLEEKDPVERMKTLGDLGRTAADPEKARQFLLRSAMVSLQRRAASIQLEDA